MSAAVVLAAALLVVLAWIPVRARPGPARSAAPARRVRGAAWWPEIRGRRRPPDLAVVVTEVASRLRTGAPPATAWALTVDRALGPAAPGGGGAGGPGRRVVGRDAGLGRAPAVSGGGGRGLTEGTAAGHPAGTDGVPTALARLVEHCAADPAAAAAAGTVLAASRLTHTLGAPLAEVLERCAATVTEAEQARDARRVALAGPRSTARILAGLPLLGLLLGAGLGADPAATATDGGWGTASVVAGLALLLAGRRWTRALVAAAERPTAARAAAERPTAARRSRRRVDR